MIGFEHDLNYLISNLEYHEYKSTFQKKLTRDIKQINSSPNVFVNADKTNNIYEIDKETYNKLMRDNVTSIYKIADNEVEEQINNKAQAITDELSISDRVDTMPRKNAYITVKDHKKEFPNNIKCRLINPTKPNIGRISKQFLDEINQTIKSQLELNQFKNTNETIEWYNTFENKTRLEFIQFDIVDFYPSVSEKLLEDALKFASQYTTITPIQIQTIKQARESILHHNNKTCSKKTGLLIMKAYNCGI